jgi:hypothetical protein
MRVYLSKYRSHWISPYRIMEKLIFWREIDYDEPFIKKCNTVLEPFSKGIQSFLDVIHPKVNYVKIDYWDTWSMDHTLAQITLPMLKQLQETKHGSPMVDEDDVPEYLRSKKKPKLKRKKSDVRNTLDVHSLDMDDTEWPSLHDRWDWVLNEMIWAFEQKVTDDDEGQFFEHSKDNSMPWDKDYVGPKVDWDGLKAHQARKENGFRLFGKYYQGLWD